MEYGDSLVGEVLNGMVWLTSRLFLRSPKGFGDASGLRGALGFGDASGLGDVPALGRLGVEANC